MITVRARNGEASNLLLNLDNGIKAIDEVARKKNKELHDLEMEYNKARAELNRAQVAAAAAAQKVFDKVHEKINAAIENLVEENEEMEEMDISQIT